VAVISCRRWPGSDGDASVSLITGDESSRGLVIDMPGVDDFTLVVEVAGTGRIIAGLKTFEGVRYRISVWRKHAGGTVIDGVLEADNKLLAEIDETGHAAIQLAGRLGWFNFVFTNVERGEIEITGSVGD
jgi:hypothetical protein